MADTLLPLIVSRLTTAWPWYIIRASGFVAAGLLALIVLSGIGQVTGFTYRFLEPIKAWAVHKALAFALLFSILVHVTFILIDKFVPFSLAQVLIPFASTYNNKTPFLGLSLGVLGVAAGILAAYLIIVIVASSLGWINSKKTIWKRLHFLGYAVAFLVFLHALLTGSDLRDGLLRLSWLLLGTVVLAGVGARLWRSWNLIKR